MGWSPLKKRVYFFLFLGFLGALNAVFRGSLSITLRTIIDSLLLLVISLSILYLVINHFMVRRRVGKEELRAKRREIYKEIAEKVLRIKKT